MEQRAKGVYSKENVKEFVAMKKGTAVEKREKKEIAFSNGDLWRLIVPLLIEQLLNCTVGLLDSLMVSTVGEAAVSAVSLVDCVNVLLLQVFAALAAGGAIVAGQYIGCREMKKACKAAQQLLLSLGVLSLAVMALMYFLADFLLHVVFGTVTPEVSGYAQTYLMIVNLSIPFIALYNGGAALFRVMGNSKISMLVALLMNAVNVGGNALLVFGFGMGVAGVAIPTVVSRVVAAAVILALLCGKKHEIHLQRGMSWRPDWGMIHNIMSVGVPNGVENSLFQLGKIVMLSLISTCGTASIAANAIGNNIAQYQILGGMSVGIAMVTVVSQCVGAGDYEKVRAYTRNLMKLSYLFILLMVGVTLALLPLILRLYNVSPEANSYAIRCILLHAISACVFWPLAFALPNTLRAAGDAKFTMVVSVTVMWIVRIGCGYLLGGYFGWGVFGVWTAMILDWCFRIPPFLLRYRGHKWEHMSLV